jgi:hypothetical protein
MHRLVELCMARCDRLVALAYFSSGSIEEINKRETHGLEQG